MNKTKQNLLILDILLKITMGLFVGLGILFGIYAASKGAIAKGLLGLASPVFLLVPLLFRRLGIQTPNKLAITLFAFLILAYDIGCVLQAFDAVLYLDKVSHFLSGIVFTILGFCVYYYLEKPYGTLLGEKWISALTYALFFSTFMAVFWEICEFAGFVLTGHDSQHHLTTGVMDTMGDLVVCFIGSLLSAASYILYVKKGARLLTGAVVADFYKRYTAEDSLVKGGLSSTKASVPRR